MFTRIFDAAGALALGGYLRRPAAVRRWGLALCAALLVAGCAVRVPAVDRADLRVAGTRVTVVAPDGFCVDPQSVDVTREGGFMLFGDCSVLNAEAVDGAPEIGVIAASISNAPVPGSLEELEAFLVDGPGIVTLGRSRQAEEISVLFSAISDGVLYVKVQDTGPSPIPGASPAFWRGFFETGDRLVFGTVTGFETAPISDQLSRALLQDLADRTRAANPEAVAPPA